MFNATATSMVIGNATITANSASGGSGGSGSSTGPNGANGASSGGGLANTGSQLRVTNTLLASNTVGATTGNCTGAISDGGHNLEFNPTITCGFTTGSPKSDVLADPKLDTLRDNGGPTQTMALLPGSAAIDTADPTACAVPQVSGKDQRGIARRADQCSIGAFEVDFAIPNPVPQPPRPGPAPSGGPPNPIPLPSRSLPSNGGVPNPIPVPRR